MHRTTQQPESEASDDSRIESHEQLARAQARIRDLEAALESTARKASGAVDIDERARGALARSEQRFRRLIENLHVGVVVQGPKSEILLFNGRALELFGLSEDELRGRTSFDPSWEVIREDGSPFLPEQRPVAMVLTTHKAMRGVVMGIKRPRTKDVVWLLVNAMPEFDEAGEVLQVVATIDDITERKKLDDSLRQTQKLDGLGLLAGGIAHDFNNLLAVITSCTELAQMQLSPESGPAQDLRTVLTAADRATGLTRQLLSFARRQVGSPCRVDICTAVSQFEQLLGRLLGERHQLVIEHEPDPVPVTIDRGQLEQVLVNLVVNARDAMPDGGCVTVSVGRVGPGHAPPPLNERAAALLCVRDHGVGMAPELLERVFEPFFTTKELGRGTGLGLATVHGIVRQAGGHISISSELGRGTEFRVFLPLLAEARRGELVLVVDDDEILRSVAVRMLGDLGYETASAADGFAALDLIEQRGGRIDVLLTDVVMPRMGGRELAHRIRERWPKVRVIAISDQLEGIGAQGYMDSVDATLAKPFDMASLGRVVRATLD